MQRIPSKNLLSSLLLRVGLLALVAAPGTASAGTIVVTVTAPVSSVFGDLTTALAPGSTISGTVELDDSVVGSFTPSGNPTFERSQMLYSGAVRSADLVAGGFAISGTGGNVVLLDASDPLAGEDNFEIIAVLDTGSIGGASPQSIVLTAEYADTEFTLASDTQLFAPSFDPARFNPFTLTSSTGGTAFGQIESLTATISAAVPLGSPAVWSLMAAAAVCAGTTALRRLPRTEA